MKPMILVLLLVAFVGLSHQKCANPKVEAQTYTTKNVLLSVETVYIAEFSIQCEGSSEDMTLYAALNDQLVPVAKSADSKKYQVSRMWSLQDNNMDYSMSRLILARAKSYNVSWTAEHKKATTGKIDIKIYDDEGFAAYRKAQRSGEAASNVEPLTVVSINHKGASKEGLGVQTEFLSAVAALLIWWLANTAKNKILE